MVIATVVFFTFWLTWPRRYPATRQLFGLFTVLCSLAAVADHFGLLAGGSSC